MRAFERFELDIQSTLEIIPQEFHALALSQAKRGHYSEDYDEIIGDLSDICHGLSEALENYIVHQYGMN